ncbi:MAG: pyrrolo-quinoline quinone [Kordiimonas sp.]|nr:pyrrolo-quinoline quinone [Kordiimonas sp.]
MTNTHTPLTIFNRFLAIAASFSVLSACSAFDGGSDDDQTVLEGERLPVLSYEYTVEADPQISALAIHLPKPYINSDWAQSGGNAVNLMQHLALSDTPKEIWDKSIGEGSYNRARLVSGPVLAGGRLYTIDVEANISSFDAQTGKKYWSEKLKAKKESGKVAYGGGIAATNDTVYATTGYGHIAAFDAQTGDKKWSVKIGVPMRGAPTVAENRVFALTHDNQIYAINADDGSIIWSEVGISENAGLMGAASPAVLGNTVVAAFSSGELVAMRVENGRILWTDTLSRRTRLNALATLTDIDGNPVINDGRVYALSHGGRMVAIELRTGARVWEKNIGGLHTPWVAGDFIYLVSTDSQVICLHKRDGRVRWVKQLQRYKDPEDRKGLLQWNGPILASDRLIVTSSHGKALSLSPYTGELLGHIKLAEDSYMSPILANQTLYFLTDDGEISALR